MVRNFTNLLKEKHKSLSFIFTWGLYLKFFILSYFLGIEKATGDYICFLDSDDFVVEMNDYYDDCVLTQLFQMESVYQIVDINDKYNCHGKL